MLKWHVIHFLDVLNVLAIVFLYSVVLNCIYNRLYLKLRATLVLHKVQMNVNVHKPMQYMHHFNNILLKLSYIISGISLHYGSQA